MLKSKFLLCLHDTKYDNDIFMMYVRFYTSAKRCDELRKVPKEKYVSRELPKYELCLLLLFINKCIR